MNVHAKPLSCFFLKNQCYMKLDVYDPTVFVRNLPKKNAKCLLNWPRFLADFDSLAVRDSV